MKKTIIFTFAAVCAANAFGQDFSATATQVWQGQIGTKSNTGLGLADAAIYSNTTTFGGQAYSNAGSANQAGNQITTMVFDDLLTTNPGVGFDSFTFSVANLNTVAVSARARVRFFADNGGTPGTLIAGFSFAATSFTAGSVGLFTATIAPLTVPVDGKIWAGITFDNNTGATGATQAQMDLLGQGIFNPPTVGSSNDTFFQTTGAGSFLVSNPGPGSLLNFSGNPVANFGWAIGASTVPEPASFAVMGLGLLGLVARRRRSSK